MWGLQAGQSFNGSVKLDAEQFSQEIGLLLQRKGWKEKGDLSPTTPLVSDVDHFIDTFTPPPEYWSCQRMMGIPYEKKSKDTTWPVQLKIVLIKTGWGGFVPWLVRWGLRRIRRTWQV